MNGIPTLHFRTAHPSLPCIRSQAGFKSWEIFKQTIQEKNFNGTILGHAFFALRLPLMYLDYFINPNKNDSVSKTVGSLLNFLSDIGSTLEWFSFLKIVDAAKVSQALGKIRFIGKFLVKIPLNSVISTLFGFANIFYSIDGVIKLSKGNLNKRETISTWLDLAVAVMQVVLFILFVAGCVSVAVSALTVIAVLMAVSAWSYRVLIVLPKAKERIA